MAGIYNWQTQIEGDTIIGKSIQLAYTEGAAIKSLVGATVEMNIFRSKTSKIYATLTFADGLIHTFLVGEFVITNPINKTLGI